MLGLDDLRLTQGMSRREKQLIKNNVWYKMNDQPVLSFC